MNHPQNWAMLQDSDGVIYFGNTSGILIYDGHFWDFLPVQNKAIVRSLAIDSQGTIFAGAIGELGYLKADSLGIMSYISLLPYIPENERTFADVWRIAITTEGINFYTFNKIMVWHKQNFKIIPLSPRSGTFLFVRDQLIQPGPAGRLSA